MTNAEIRAWAKEKIKGKIWEILPALIVASIITNLSFSTSSTAANGEVVRTTYSFGWLFYFVEVGMTYFLVKFVTDQKYEFNDIFHFAKDFGRCLGTNLLAGIKVFLWALLLIVPGIMKAFSYAMIPYLLADEKYKDLKITEILAKSEEMMNGHRMDLFMLILSFIGWHILAAFTLFLLEIWVAPYQSVAMTKFLNDIKTKAEGGSTVKEANVVEDLKAEGKENSTTALYCPNCGTEVKDGTVFCPNCGQQIVK